MPFQHKMQTSRFELKYIIDDRCADAIRDFLHSHLEPDEHAKPENDYTYHICSLYVDNPALDLYGQTAQGMKNRFKLRIRFYDDNPQSPVFLEIKRRITDVIRKERAAVTREGALQVLAGGFPNPSILAGENGSRKSGVALQNFCSLTSSIGGRGCIYVSYNRRAYVSPDSDQVRVTFDTDLYGTAYEQGSELVRPMLGAKPKLGGTILELKFTDRFPGWMRDLAQAFNLQRTSVPKYCLCIERMGLKPDEWRGAELGRLL